MGSSAVPLKSLPGTSSGMLKLGGEMISTEAKRTHRCSFSVDIEKKSINDQVVTVYKLNNYYYDYPMNEQNRPLEKEYTDAKAFAQAVHDQIIGIGEQL